MKKLMVFVALVSMSLSMTATAHAAASVFPFADQYDASYLATQGSTTWTPNIAFTGSTTLQGKQWLAMEQINWNGDGSNPSQDVRVTGPNAKTPDTANTLYYYDSTQASAADPYSIPLFEEGNVGATWTYTDTNHNNVTALIQSIGSVTVPAGIYQGAYKVLYTDANPPVNVNRTMWWKPGVGLIQETDNIPPTVSTTPITWQLTSHPFAELLVGIWTGNMDIVVPGTSAVEKGTVQVNFDQVANTTQAYTGTLTWTPVAGSSATPITLSISVIRGPFDPTLLHITAVNNVILGEMRKVGPNYVVDLHGSDVNSGDTYVALGLSKE